MLFNFVVSLFISFIVEHLPFINVVSIFSNLTASVVLTQQSPLILHRIYKLMFSSCPHGLYWVTFQSSSSVDFVWFQFRSFLSYRVRINIHPIFSGLGLQQFRFILINQDVLPLSYQSLRIIILMKLHTHIQTHSRGGASRLQSSLPVRYK